MPPFLPQAIPPLSLSCHPHSTGQAPLPGSHAVLISLVPAPSLSLLLSPLGGPLPAWPYYPLPPTFFPHSPPKADCPLHRPHCPPLSAGLLGPLRPTPLPFPGLLLYFALRRAAHLGSQAAEPQLWIIGAWRCGPTPLGWPPQGPIIAIRAELSFGPTRQPASLGRREGGAWHLS